MQPPPLFTVLGSNNRKSTGLSLSDFQLKPDVLKVELQTKPIRNESFSAPT